jgi:hypothetical protein
MTVRILDVMSGGGTIINGTAIISSNETPTATGSPARTMVVPTTRPSVGTVVEVGTNSMFVPREGAWTIRIDGSNFRDGAVVDFGPDILAEPAALEGSVRLYVPIAVSAAAGLGPRSVTVTNPDGLSGSKPAALAVVRPTDINRDCRVDGADLNLLARAWNTAVSEAGFLAAADLDGDDYVGPLDLAILAEYFGQRLGGTCTAN